MRALMKAFLFNEYMYVLMVIKAIEHFRLMSFDKFVNKKHTYKALCTNSLKLKYILHT